METREYETLITNFNTSSEQLERALQIISEYSVALGKLEAGITSLQKKWVYSNSLPISELAESINENNHVFIKYNDSFSQIKESVSSLERRMNGFNGLNTERHSEILARLDRILPLMEQLYYTFVKDYTTDQISNEPGSENESTKER